MTHKEMRGTKTNKMNKENKDRSWSSEHHCNSTMIMSSEERREANMDARDISICVIPDSVDTEDKDEYEECTED
jgi:hypothetical protein